MSTTELADLLGISTVKVESDRRKGQGPPFLRMDGRSIRYERTVVLQWIVQHTVQPVRPPFQHPDPANLKIVPSDDPEKPWALVSDDPEWVALSIKGTGVVLRFTTYELAEAWKDKQRA